MVVCEFPHPQTSLKQFSNFCKNVVYFLWLWRGVKKCYRIFAKQFIKINLKNVSVGSFSRHFATTVPHTVILNSEKLTHPTVQYLNLVFSPWWKSNYSKGYNILLLAPSNDFNLSQRRWKQTYVDLDFAWRRWPTREAGGSGLDLSVQHPLHQVQTSSCTPGSTGATNFQSWAI